MIRRPEWKTSQQELLKLMVRSGRDVTLTALIDWRNDGLLPPLANRGAGPGKGKYYFWGEDNIFEQACFVHDLVQKSAWPFLFALPGLLAVVVGWMQGRSTELRVTSSELVATGNIGKWLSTEVRVPASEIKSIGFRAGGHGRRGGLYAKHGWKNTCLLPGLNPQQAGAIARTIFRRFPDIGPEDDNPDSLLFGMESDLTVLGLTTPETTRPSAQ